MTGTEEMHLYLTNREEWAAYMAPRWQAMRWTDEGKRNAWRFAGKELRAELKRLGSAA